MNLKEFRELTKDMPDEMEIIMEAKPNPCGNCWEVIKIEQTSLAFFGKKIPAIKLKK